MRRMITSVDVCLKNRELFAREHWNPQLTRELLSLLKPSSRILFKAIYGFVEATDIYRRDAEDEHSQVVVA